MSFANAMAVVQKPLLNMPYGMDPRYRSILAVRDAALRSNLISVSDIGTDGKNREVRINYYPIDCDAEGTCNTDLCEDGEVMQLKQENFKLKKCTSSKKYQVRLEDIRLVDGAYTFSDHARMVIMSGMDSVRKALNSEINSWLVANVGCQPDGQPVKKISLTDPVSGAIRPKGLFEIERTFTDAGLTTPFVIGGQEIFQWQSQRSIAGINSSGQRLDQLNLTNLYYDQGLEDTFGDPDQGHIVAFDPSSIKFIAWSENAGMFATDLTSIDDMDKLFKEGTNHLYGSIVDPVTGLIWDLDIIMNVCGKKWNINYQLNWDIFKMPESVCNIDCVNGIFHFTTCLAAPVECPAVTPPTPVTPSVYEWTPDLEDPTYLSDITLGGQSTMINATVTNLVELAAVLNANIVGYKFSVVGSEIVYTGFQAISGTANGGTVVIEFSVATT